MEVTWQTFLILLPLTGLAGFVDAIAGGGGLISIPAYMLAGCPPHIAIATNKVSAGMGLITANSEETTPPVTKIYFAIGSLLYRTVKTQAHYERDLPLLLDALQLLLAGAAHMKIQEANATAKVINLCTCISSLAVYLINGQVLIILGLAAGLTSTIGAWIGTKMFDRDGSGIVKPIIILVIAIFFIKIIIELIS